MLTADNDAVVLSDRRVQVRVQGSNECKLFRGGSLFHVLVDGLAEVVDGLLVTLGGGVHNAVFQMVLQYQLAGVVDGRAHSGALNQHLRAIPALLYHVAHRLQVADSPGEPVQHRFGVFVAVGMAVPVAVMLVVMGDAVGVHIFVVVDFGSIADIPGCFLYIVHRWVTSPLFYPKRRPDAITGLGIQVKNGQISDWKPGVGDAGYKVDPGFDKWSGLLYNLRKYRTMLAVHERVNFSRLLPARISITRQVTFDSCSSQSTKIPSATEPLDYAVFP